MTKKRSAEILAEKWHFFPEKLDFFKEKLDFSQNVSQLH